MKTLLREAMNTLLWVILMGILYVGLTIVFVDSNWWG
jgi:hypothetical protein